MRERDTSQDNSCIYSFKVQKSDVKPDERHAVSTVIQGLKLYWILEKSRLIAFIKKTTQFECPSRAHLQTPHVNVVFQLCKS